MKNVFRLAAVSAMGVAALSVSARTQDLAMWKGETTIVRLTDFVKVDGELPKGVTMRFGALCDVNYRESPEAVRWQQTSFDLYKWPEIDRTLKPLHLYTVADRVSFDPSAKGPRIAEIAVATDAKPGEYLLGDLKLTIADRVLPPVKDQKGFLDLWQHPWSVARVFGVKPFSNAHYAKMEPLWKLLAEYGGRTLTVTLVKEPWNHQCHDAYQSMVVKTRMKDGTWRYDFSLFDEYVEFGRKCGLGPAIMCYTMCPWEYRVDWREEDGTVRREPAVPGTDFFREYWGAFLPVFAAHLKEKGWFEDTYVSMDERKDEDVAAIAKILKEKAPGIKISMAGANSPEKMGIDIACFSLGMSHISPEFSAEAEKRRKEGKQTTIYACCWPPRPNTFMSSGPGEAFWLGFAPMALGFDGFLRWAYNSWGADPMNDMSYDQWLAGDVALVYPDASPSWRLVELRRGMIAAEKLRILKAEGKVHEDLADLVSSLDAIKAMKGEVIFQMFEEQVLKALSVH